MQVSTAPVSATPETRLFPDGNGNTFVLWNPVGTTNLWANRYEAGRGWGTAQLLDAQASPSYEMAVDADGNALLVGSRASTGTDGTLWAKRYTAGTGWGTTTFSPAAEGLFTQALFGGFFLDPGAQGRFFVSMAVNAQGGAVVAWRARLPSSVGSAYGAIALWATRFSASAGWEAPRILSFTEPQLPTGQGASVDAQGNAMVFWKNTRTNNFPDSTSAEFLSRRYVAGTGWGALEPTGVVAVNASVIQTGSTTLAYAFDQQGMVTNSFSPSTGWGTPAQWSSGTSGLGYSTARALDAAGNPVLLWAQQAGDSNAANIWFRRHINGAWQAPQLVEALTGSITGLTLGFDSAGHATAAWEPTAAVPRVVAAKRYLATTGWQAAPSSVVTYAPGNEGMDQLRSSAVGLGVDRQGHVTAVMQVPYPVTRIGVSPSGVPTAAVIPLYRIWAARYTAGTGWAAPQRIDTDSEIVGLPTAGFDASGNAWAVWPQAGTTGANQLWANTLR